MCPSSGEITVIYTTLGICHSVRMTVWFAGWNSTLLIRQSSTQIQSVAQIQPFLLRMGI